MNLAILQFSKIVFGKKTIESRLYDKKRQQLQVGDIVVFTERDHPENKVRVRITDLLRHKTFKELFENQPVELFGGDNVDSLLHEIGAFYSSEDELQYGVVGIQFELVGRSEKE